MSTDTKTQTGPKTAGYESWYDRVGEGWLDNAPRAIIEDTPLRLQFIRQVLGSDFASLKVLDLGMGGVGLLPEGIAREGADVTVVERHRRSLELAEAHARKEGLTMQFSEGEFANLPFPEASFDAVTAFGVLEHAGPNLDKWLDEVRRVLKPGGAFIYNLLNRTGTSKLMFIRIHVRILKLDPPGHHNFDWFITPEEIRAALERHGFQHKEQIGIMSSKTKPIALFNVLTRRGLPGGYKLGPDLSVVFMGHAVKEAG